MKFKTHRMHMILDSWFINKAIETANIILNSFYVINFKSIKICKEGVMGCFNMLF
jgi:hypothetical protein